MRGETGVIVLQRHRSRIGIGIADQRWRFRTPNKTPLAALYAVLSASVRLATGALSDVLIRLQDWRTLSASRRLRQWLNYSFDPLLIGILTRQSSSARVFFISP